MSKHLGGKAAERPGPLHERRAPLVAEPPGEPSALARPLVTAHEPRAAFGSMARRCVRLAVELRRKEDEGERSEWSPTTQATLPAGL